MSETQKPEAAAADASGSLSISEFTDAGKWVVQ